MTSMVIRDCIGFHLLRSVICQEISRHSRDKSDANLNHGSEPAFSLALDSLVLLSSLLIGRYDYFGFGFTTLNRKSLYRNEMSITVRNGVF